MEFAIGFLLSAQVADAMVNRLADSPGVIRISFVGRYGTWQGDMPFLWLPLTWRDSESDRVDLMHHRGTPFRLSPYRQGRAVQGAGAGQQVEMCLSAWLPTILVEMEKRFCTSQGNRAWFHATTTH